jgi:transcriptional antiterminator NusG
MAKQWYVVHTFSGYEYKVKTALEERIKTLGKQEFFGEVLVPTEKVVELVKGKKKTSSRKFFPGYILVQMEMNEETWHIVKGTPKVTGFVGGGTNPPPVPDEEVKAITHQMEEGAAKPRPRVLFSVGESVKVVDGPFADFNGVVEEVKPEKGKLRVLISIFGRATPVELDFVQVERN